MIKSTAYVIPEQIFHIMLTEINFKVNQFEYSVPVKQPQFLPCFSYSETYFIILFFK